MRARVLGDGQIELTAESGAEEFVLRRLREVEAWVSAVNYRSDGSPMGMRLVSVQIAARVIERAQVDACSPSGSPSGGFDEEDFVVEGEGDEG